MKTEHQLDNNELKEMQLLLDRYSAFLSSKLCEDVTIKYVFDPELAEGESVKFSVTYASEKVDYNNAEFLKLINLKGISSYEPGLLISDVAYAHYIFSSYYQTNKNRGEINASMRVLLSVEILLALVAISVVVGLVVSPFILLPAVVSTLVQYLIIPSSVYLSVLSYGIINDLLAVRQNLVYFFAGHNLGQKSLIKTNRKNAIAIAWGIIATGILAIIFAGLMGLEVALTYSAAASLGLSAASVGMFPVLASFAVLGYALCYLLHTLGAAHKHALAPQGEQNWQYKSAWGFGELTSYTRINARREVGLSEEKAAKWVSNSERNVVGYNLVGFGFGVLGIQFVAMAVTLTLIAIPQVHVFCSHLLASKVGATIISLLTTGLPIGMAGVVGLFVFASLTYLAVTHFHNDKSQQECLRDFSGAEPVVTKIELSSSPLFKTSEEVVEEAAVATSHLEAKAP